eukprot:g12181.t1
MACNPQVSQVERKIWKIGLWLLFCRFLILFSILSSYLVPLLTRSRLPNQFTFLHSSIPDCLTRTRRRMSSKTTCGNDVLWLAIEENRAHTH